MKTVEYETSTGIRVRLKPISSDLLTAIAKQVQLPEPPTYEHKILGGEVEHVYHTKDTLETDEEKKAWKEYQKQLKEANFVAYQNKTRAIMRRCVLVELPESEDWVRLQEADGIEVPTDPLDRRYHYITTEVVGSLTDVFSIVEAVERISEFNPEDLETARDMFRRQMERETAA